MKASVVNTPYEELEYVAEFLPEEGEAIVLVRRNGDLVCEPFQKDQIRPALSNQVEFFGHLVQANERLWALAVYPVWCCAALFLLTCILVHKLTWIGWSGWYWDVGIGLLTIGICYIWIRFRRSRYFHNQLQPMLVQHMRRCSIEKYSLIGDVRKEAKLKSLMAEMWRWEA
jgi:hypothetical protein